IDISASAFASFSERDNPVGIAAIAKPPTLALESLPVRSDSIFIALYKIRNPGNLGTIVRTADSIGSAGIILIGNTVDPFDPSCIKASMGTVFNVPIVKVKDENTLVTWCSKQGIKTITTSSRAKSIISDCLFSFPCIILLGSETQGLPEELLNSGDYPVRIPMYGQANSLNLAVAAGIIMYEVKKTLNEQQSPPEGKG
ncbi:MAG: RNA methyltransferase, partial [bacterium]|nr:RNA methyltransferase [bacterium]